MASPLLTSEQAVFEHAQATLLKRPEVAAARAMGRELMRSDVSASTVDGARRIENALDRWLSRLCLMTVMRSDSAPAILWCNQLSAYRSHGLEVPASAAAVDTPDFIYRFAVIDGAQSYAIDGSARVPSAGLLIQVSDDHAGSEGFALPTDGHDMESLGVVNADTFGRDSNGAFRTFVGPAPGRGGLNYIRVPPRQLQIIFRDVLNDWNEHVHALKITPLSAPIVRDAPTIAAVAASIALDFPPLVVFWLRMKSRLWADLAPNRPYGPSRRAHDWGLSLTARFHLAPDEALVMTVANVHAAYFGVQIADVWMMLPDPAVHTSSLNRAQSRLDARGNFTYVVCPTDPGCCNWLDTAGALGGSIQYRWIAISRDANTETIVRRFEIMKLDDLAGKLQLPRMDPESRNKEIAQREIEWRLRVAPYEGESSL
jgi:hypothetical protein